MLVFLSISLTWAGNGVWLHYFVAILEIYSGENLKMRQIGMWKIWKPSVGALWGLGVARPEMGVMEDL